MIVVKFQLLKLEKTREIKEEETCNAAGAVFFILQKHFLF